MARGFGVRLLLGLIRVVAAVVVFAAIQIPQAGVVVLTGVVLANAVLVMGTHQRWIERSGNLLTHIARRTIAVFGGRIGTAASAGAIDAVFAVGALRLDVSCDLDACARNETVLSVGICRTATFIAERTAYSAAKVVDQTHTSLALERPVLDLSAAFGGTLVCWVVFGVRDTGITDTAGRATKYTGAEGQDCEA